MKSLTEFIKEQIENDLYLTDAIEYDKYQDLYLYLVNSDLFSDRLQAICDTFRKKYNENISVDVLLRSEIFKKFINDLISSYCKDINKINVNVATRKHLDYEIASKMISKILLERDLPEPEEI